MRIDMKLRHIKGFTLIELLLVIVILGVISGSVGFMFVGGLRAWNTEEIHSELLHNNQGVVVQISDALEWGGSIAILLPCYCDS